MKTVRVFSFFKTMEVSCACYVVEAITSSAMNVEATKVHSKAQGRRSVSFSRHLCMSVAQVLRLANTSLLSRFWGRDRSTLRYALQKSASEPALAKHVLSLAASVAAFHGYLHLEPRG